jgi:hypothetical protein
MIVASIYTPAPWTVYLLNQAGATLVHRHMNTTPEALRKAIAPDRAQIVMAAAWMLTWGLAC